MGSVIGKTGGTHDINDAISKIREKAISPGIYDIIKMIECTDHTDDLVWLNKTTITITSNGRDYIPAYTTYENIVEEYKKQHPEFDLGHVSSRFFSRETPGPYYHKISENEYLYRDYIIKSSANKVLINPNFIHESTHMWNPDVNGYSCALDIRTTDLSSDQITSFQKGIEKYYPGQFYYLFHQLPKGEEHLHVNHIATWNSYKDRISATVNKYCGYSAISSDQRSRDGGFSVYTRQPKVKSDAVIKDSNMAEAEQLEMSGLTEQVKQDALTYVNDTDTRELLPDDLDEVGLMDVIKIGDISFDICPITQINYSQSMQYVRFSTLRTKGDPKIATDTVNNNVTINIIFPNADAINHQLADLVAQFIATPITVVQSRFIARVLKPVRMNHLGEIEDVFAEGKKTTPLDESMWMVMTDINIRTIPNFPEAWEAYITLEPFEDRCFSQLRFLNGYSDLREKYRRKSVISGGSFCVPSEMNQLEAVKTFKYDTINVTSDPNSSVLYKDFYKSVKSTFQYDPAVYAASGGKFIVWYNSQNMSRENTRKVLRQMSDSYNQSLIDAQNIITAFGKSDKGGTAAEKENWMRALGYDVILPETIKRIAKGTEFATRSLLKTAARESEGVKFVNGLRIGVFGDASTFKILTLQGSRFVKSVGDAYGLDGFERSIVYTAFTKTVATLGQTISKTDIFNDVVPIKDANGNPISDQISVASAGKFSDPDGLVGIFEAFLNHNLTVDVDKKSTKPDGKVVARLQNQITKITKSFKALSDFVLNPADTTKGQAQLDEDGLPTYPNQYTEISLVDGVNSYISGISFSMNNKVVPQQVIGWRQPMFQHLGRSDWSINMSVVCKGDETVKKIMYVLYRTGILSKQIQLTSPAKFVNLDTNLTIHESDPIFRVLGINSVALNSVEVSSIPGQPNMYQLSLTMEQSDLDIRDTESLTQTQFKQQNKELSAAIGSQIGPVLKAFIGNPRHPQYGRFLNFRMIKNYIEDPALQNFWMAYGLSDGSGNDVYDYMDKWNFFKLLISTESIVNPAKDFSTILDHLFPLKGSVPVNRESELNSILNKIKFPHGRRPTDETQQGPVKSSPWLDPQDDPWAQQVSDESANSIFSALATLYNLYYEQSQDQVIWSHGATVSKEAANALSTKMDSYFEGIGHLYNSYINEFVNQIDKNKTGKGFMIERSMSTGEKGALDVLIGVTVSVAVGVAAAVIGLSASPIVIGIVVLAGIGGGMGTNKVLTKTQDVIQFIRDAIPGIMPLAFQSVINGKMNDLIVELLVDPTALNLFSSNFIVGYNGSEPIYLNKLITDLRNKMGDLMSGCYNDFDEIIRAVASKGKISASLLDPAFYLHGIDFITSDLIRDVKADIDNQISMLNAKAVIYTMQLGAQVEQNYNISPKTSLEQLGTITVSPDSVVTAEDLKWVVATKRQIADLTIKVMEEPSKQNLENYKSLQSKTDFSFNTFINDYWGGPSVVNDYWKESDQKGAISDSRTYAVMEQAYARLQLVSASLSFDALRLQLKQATEKFNNLNVTVTANTETDPVKRAAAEAERLKKDPTQQRVNKSASLLEVQQYQILFNDKSFDGTQTWYDAIMNAGGIDNPYKNAQSVNSAFKQKLALGVNGSVQEDMRTYFKGKMSEMLGTIEVMAKCKKAMQNNNSAKMMATNNGIDADPQMIQKRIDEVASVQNTLLKTGLVEDTGNPIRIFPTFKIYFIEENAPEWGIYNEFYDYSAVQEINVVSDRESASSTCTIKLSNVAGKLTDTFAQNIPKFGFNSVPMNSMMLKPGVSILVKMGYSNSQVELPVVFYGIVMEVAPGPIVEVVCQGYGAELSETVAPNEGVHHGVFGDVKGLGDVATWAIQQTTGMSHFGSIGYDQIGVSDSLRLSGSVMNGLQGKIKIISWLSGLPGFNMNDPRDDNVFLPYNMANITDANITGTLDLAIKYVMSKFDTSGDLNFDWYIRDQSIWDILRELVWFSPDFIRAVLPYNDNVFPFIPKIRNTLYVGPKRGYYKYTDLYSLKGATACADIPNADKLAQLLSDLAKFMLTWVMNHAGAYEILFATDHSTKSFTELWDAGQVFGDPNDYLPQSSQYGQIMSLLNSDVLLKSVIETFFTTNLTPTRTTINYKLSTAEAVAVGRMALKYAEQYLDFSQVKNIIKTNLNLTDVNNAILNAPTINDKSLRKDLTSRIKHDIGMNGQYYNKLGGNDQYKRVQCNHLATSYTNILSNNIIATGDGWANQIKLICPPDPKDWKTIEDVDISDRKDFITTIFNLDDDILNDHIRTKSVFVNNIDPSTWDDAWFANKVFNGESSFTTIIGDKYVSLDGNDGIGTPVVKDNNMADGTPTSFKDKNGNVVTRNAWEQLPSRWRVGISILAEETKNMYDGELVITGNANIKPFDIIHILDYTNDMQGAVEVGRVIHTLSTQSGFVTRIKPDLIVRQKQKFTLDEIAVAGRLLQHSTARGNWQAVAGGIGVAGSVFGIEALASMGSAAVGPVAGTAVGTGTTAVVTAKTLADAKLAVTVAEKAVESAHFAVMNAGADAVAAETAAATLGTAEATLGTAIAAADAAGAGIAAGTVAATGTTAATVLGTAASILGFVGYAAAAVGIAYLGYKYLDNGYQRVVQTMNNIIGRDSLDIMPLIYRGLPYVAGVEGIKKDGYMRHLSSMVYSKDTGISLFDRLGYANGPIEYEFYKNIAGDSPAWSFIETNIINPGTQGQGGLFDMTNIIAQAVMGR